jgi:hypothetical protein
MEKRNIGVHKIAQESHEKSHMAEVREIPLDADTDAMFNQAQDFADNYAVVFAVEAEVFGSGTLVKFQGVHEILTAEHVASVPRKHKGEQFAICYRSDSVHTLFVNSSHFKKFDFGDSEKNGSEESGPDICFLMITDDSLLSRLSAKKSFYPLGDEHNITAFNPRFSRMPWWVSGGPKEFTKSAGLYRRRKLTRCQYLHAGAKFLSMAQRDNFDYISLKVEKGIDGYPNDCGGMSGGSVWLLGAHQSEHGVMPTPLLQGVLFYQSYPPPGAVERVLVGHGPFSIHNRIVELVKPSTT